MPIPLNIAEQATHSGALASAIVGHLVGDYLLQNDWMANNKKRSSNVCFIHCLIWSWSVCLFAGWYGTYTFALAWYLLFLTHFIQDRTNIVTWWMNLIGQRRFMKSDDFDMINFKIIPGLGPWSIIVVDNVWHIVTIWLVWRFVV